MNKIIKILTDNGYNVVFFPEHNEIWIANEFKDNFSQGFNHITGFNMTEFFKQQTHLETQSEAYVLQRVENEMANMNVLKCRMNSRIHYFCYGK